MKKKLLIAFIVSLVINLLLFSINMVGANIFHKLPVSKAIPGGECVEYIGFGVYLLAVFPMTADGGASVTYSVGFSLISFIIPLIVIFILVFIIELIINKIRSKKNV